MIHGSMEMLLFFADRQQRQFKKTFGAQAKICDAHAKSEKLI